MAGLCLDLALLGGWPSIHASPLGLWWVLWPQVTGLGSARRRPSSKTFHHPSGPLMRRAGMRGTVSEWQPRPPGSGSNGTLHPPGLFANSSLSPAFESTCHPRSASWGAAPVARFSLLAAWFTCVSNITSFYFRLLIAHLPCPSSTHSSWYPHRAGRAVGVERSGKRDLGWQAGWLRWYPGPDVEA